MSATMVIRAAEKQDLPVIVDLLTQLTRAEGREVAVDKTALGDALFGAQRGVGIRALVMQQEAQVIAVALYYPGYDVLTTSRGYHLSDVVVDERFRGNGIGKRLFSALAAQNLREGGEWLSLTVLRENAAAQGFYRALGMTHVPVDFFAIGQIGLRAVSTLLHK